MHRSPCFTHHAARFSTAALLASFAGFAQAKVVWEADFETVTNITDLDYNQDGVPDGRLVNSSGNEINLVPIVGPDGQTTTAARFQNNNNSNGTTFRIGQQGTLTNAFTSFNVNDADDDSEQTLFRIRYAMQVESYGKPGVFGPGAQVRQGGTTAGANLVATGFNTQIGAGDPPFLGIETNPTLHMGYSTGRAPGDAVSPNANDYYGFIDPIGLTLENPTADSNGDGKLTLPPQPALYMQNQQQQSFPGGDPIDPAIVTDQWHDFGQFDVSDPSVSNTGGWVMVDMLINADPDRAGGNSTGVGENLATFAFEHVNSGDNVIQTEQIWIDDVKLSGNENSFTFFTLTHGGGSPNTSTVFDDVKLEALIYADLNGDDVLDAGDIDALRGLSAGAVTTIDAQLADLNADANLDPTQVADNGSPAESDLDELVFNVLGSLYGDANLNGTVEQGDLNAVLNNWGSTGGGWALGDLNGSGSVEQGDLNAVLNNWGSQAAPDFAGFAVPEPASVIGLLAVVAGLRTRRRA
ncbi:MAG: PEP-CTERM sorting domain-containing protein [Planctomycetota bacterium]